MMRQMKIVLTLCVFLSTAAAANATWTPTKPGDPRHCPLYPQPAHCASDAAELAFKAKYQRVTGHPFGNMLQCLEAGNLLTYTCAYGSPSGTRQTVVRFSHKRTGWKAAVGVIAA